MRGKVVAALVLGVVLVGPLLAGPREELLRLVPDDVGFCLLVQDLRRHSANFRGSPFYAQLKDSPLAAVLMGAKEKEQMARTSEVLTSKLGVDWPTLRDEVLGDAFAFAYRPPSADKSRPEEGVFLLRARNSDRLARLLDHLNKAEKKDSELKSIEEKQHDGATYYRRVGRKKTSYYYVRGPVLVMSEQEKAVQQAIEQAHSESGERLALRRLREAEAEQAAAALWINPRAFDPAMQEGSGADPRAAAAARQLGVYWKALDSAVLSLHLDKDISLSLTMQLSRERLPAAAQRWLTGRLEVSPLWARFPSDPLLAVAGRFDASGLFVVLSDFLPPQARQSLLADLNRSMGAVLDKDVVKDVLPALGPDCGLCVMAPARGEGIFPQVLLALRVQPGREEDALDQALVSALSSLATLYVVHHNQQDPDHPITLRRTGKDRQEIKYLRSTGFPAGIEPAMTLQRGFLVLATSVPVLRRFVAAAPAAPEGPGVPLLRISFRAWRDYLAEHRQALGKPLAGSRGAPAEEVRQQLDDLFAALQLLDRLELRQRVRGEQIFFTLNLQPAHALRR
jgi:hypothetical protein